MIHYTTQDGLAGESVRVILEDRAGALWIGADQGLSRLTGSGFTTLTETDGLSSNRISSLYEDDAGILWIGTLDNGLNRLADGRLTRYTTEQGLYNNGVYQILEDNHGFFWMSCHLGIYRIRRQELNDFAAGRIPRIISTYFGKADGLISVECSNDGQPTGFKAHDGRLWFPTRNGVAVIDPELAPTNLQPAAVVIESCLLDNTPVAFDRPVRISPGQESFEIQYTGLSFINSDQIKFKYKLEGLNHDWVEAGVRRAAYYSRVPPGEYLFKVIADNAEGQWNWEGKSLRIIVLPPFYRTWWFLGLTALLVGGAVFAAYEHRVWRLKRAQAAQQEFSRQLIHSQESERKRIAVELHDSLSQNLVIIKNRAMISLQEPDDPEHAFEQMEEIAGAADHALAEVREIAHNLRPFQIDRLGVTKAIEALTRKANTHELQFTATLDKIDSLLPPESEINLYRIIQECINNIVKHSRATQASVTIRRNEQIVEVIVQDNGRGFMPSAMQLGQSQNGTGLGLAGIVERARILGSLPVIESAPGKGATVSLKIKLGEIRK